MMKLLLSTLALTAATPAFAHGGAHIHPHGTEVAIAASLILAAIVGYVMTR